MSMTPYRHHGVDERGFGLIEALVALLLLSIVAMGFLSVQGRLMVTSADAAFHTQAIQLMSNDYHAIRSFSSSQKDSYAQTLRQIAQSADGGIEAYQRTANAAIINCHQGCTPQELARSLAIRSAQSAGRSKIVLSVTTCATGRCWVAAWGDQASGLLNNCPHLMVRAVNDKLNNCIMMGGL